MVNNVVVDVIDCVTMYCEKRKRGFFVFSERKIWATMGTNNNYFKGCQGGGEASVLISSLFLVYTVLITFLKGP